MTTAHDFSQARILEKFADKCGFNISGELCIGGFFIVLKPKLLPNEDYRFCTTEEASAFLRGFVASAYLLEKGIS